MYKTYLTKYIYIYIYYNELDSMNTLTKMNTLLNRACLKQFYLRGVFVVHETKFRRSTWLEFLSTRRWTWSHPQSVVFLFRRENDREPSGHVVGRSPFALRHWLYIRFQARPRKTKHRGIRFPHMRLACTRWIHFGRDIPLSARALSRIAEQ